MRHLAILLVVSTCWADPSHSVLRVRSSDGVVLERNNGAPSADLVGAVGPGEQVVIVPYDGQPSVAATVPETWTQAAPVWRLVAGRIARRPLVDIRADVMLARRRRLRMELSVARARLDSANTELAADPTSADAQAEKDAAQAAYDALLLEVRR